MNDLDYLVEIYNEKFDKWYPILASKGTLEFSLGFIMGITARTPHESFRVVYQDKVIKEVSKSE